MPYYDPLLQDYAFSPFEIWLGNKARSAFYKALAAANVYPVGALRASLKEAINADDPKAITALVKKNPRILRAELDDLVRPPLMNALVFKKYAAAEAMLAAEPGLIADKDYFGATPIVQMANAGFSDDDNIVRAITFLLKHGASLEEQSAEGNTALAAAAERGDPRVAAFLLDQGANIEAKDAQGLTPLIIACSYYDRDAVAKLLVDRDADLNAQSIHGYTAAAMAVRCGNESLARYLIARGGKINFGAEGMEKVLSEPPQNWSPDFITLLHDQKAEWDKAQREAVSTEAAQEMVEGLEKPVTVHHQLHLKQPGKKTFLFKR